MSDIPIIQCPLDCLPAFGEVWNGQYDHPVIDRVLQEDAVYSPKIIDVGANIGSFTLWAHQRWPKAEIMSYEPHPELFKFLKSNCDKICRPVNAAVTNKQTASLYIGQNRLCNSLNKWERSTGKKIDVAVENVILLPQCDILKLDCEGSEADILENLTYTPSFLMMEWHSEALRMRCEKAVFGKMMLVDSTVCGAGFGMMKFVRIRR